MAQLCRTLAAMEESLIALERRGISLRTHALRQDPVTRQAPHLPRVRRLSRSIGSPRAKSSMPSSPSRKKKAARSRSSVPRPAPPSWQRRRCPASRRRRRPGKSQRPRPHARLNIVELHEVRSINTLLSRPATHGLRHPIAHSAGAHRHRRTSLRAPRGENSSGLEDLRGLLAAIRAAGEKGLSITRFKGLGEMNAEELRDTTLDPANRTLLQVTMEDVAGADELFRILMGDHVEPRREFIEKHALEVRNLDV